MIKWQDITSYRRDDKERIPKTYVIKHGNIRMSISTDHIYYPGKFVLNAQIVGIKTGILKNVKTMTEAQAAAIRIVDKRINELREEMDAIKDATQ
ncbi:MAG: hypothetical protein K0U20_08655 [Proteobacteria bacterium]|nr:hypothetical protein [Pseudomonadota bacterium]